MEKLKDSFLDKSNTNSESIFTFDGIYEYIEDISWNLSPGSCDSSCSEIISKILDSDRQARRDIQHALEYEMEHGRGSYKKSLDNALQELKLPEIISAFKKD